MIKKYNILLILLINLIISITVVTAHDFSHNRNVIISIPKSGTHLLLKTIELLNPRLNYQSHLTPPGICLFNSSIINTLLRREVYLASHAIYVNENIKHLNNPTIKTFFIYRDPRDQIVSAAFMIKAYPKSWPKYAHLDLPVIIDELIVGGGQIWGAKFGAKDIWARLHGINEFYNLYLPWSLEPNVYTTTFEKLVGPQGGGTEEDQLHEIISIAQHMGKLITYEQAESIAKKMFGSTATFREGKIGAWKKHFLQRHIEATKKIAGQLLIDLGYEKDLNW